MVYGKCQVTIYILLATQCCINNCKMFTQGKRKRKKEKIQIIKSGKYCRDLQRSKAACQLFVNVVYKEIKQGGKGAREIRRRQWKSKFSAIIDFVLKQLLPDRERERSFSRFQRKLSSYSSCSVSESESGICTSISLTPHWGTFIHLKWYSNIV